VAVIYTTPLAVVVIVTGVLTPVVLLSLIAVTQVRPGRAHGEASSTPPLVITSIIGSTLRTEVDRSAVRGRSVGIPLPPVRYPTP
jgi:hypothetical protein